MLDKEKTTFMKQDAPAWKEILLETIKAVIIAVILGVGAIIYSENQKEYDQKLDYNALKGELIARVGTIKIWSTNRDLNKKYLFDDIIKSNYISYGTYLKYKDVPLRALALKILVLSKDVDDSNKNKLITDIFTLETMAKICLQEDVLNGSNIDAFNKTISSIEQSLEIINGWEYSGYKWGPLLD
jgi:hypothetical protein